MRYILSDEERTLVEMIAPYMVTDKEKCMSYLREDAPADIIAAKERLHLIREQHRAEMP